MASRGDYTVGGFETPVRTVSLSPGVCVLLVVAIISCLLAVGFFAMGALVDASSADVDVILQISGNDVLVTVVDGNSASQIAVLSAYLDEDPESKQMVKNPAVDSAVTFSGMGEGVSGYKFVIVEAKFADGTEAVVDYVRMRFS